MNPRLLPLTLLIAATSLLLGGCASFRQFYADGARNAAAKDHRGSAFKPLINSRGEYVGYTQKVGGDTYIHSPSGSIISVRRARDEQGWIDHHDEQGRLVRQTLEGAVQAEVTYHYDEQGELINITSWSRSTKGDH